MAGANAVFTGEQMLTTPCMCLSFCVAIVLNWQIVIGSPWDEDKAMMERWGLEGMRSFEQVNVARKEGFRSQNVLQTEASNVTPSSAEPQVTL